MSHRATTHTTACIATTGTTAHHTGRASATNFAVSVEHIAASGGSSASSHCHATLGTHRRTGSSQDARGTSPAGHAHTARSSPVASSTASTQSKMPPSCTSHAGHRRQCGRLVPCGHGDAPITVVAARMSSTRRVAYAASAHHRVMLKLHPGPPIVGEHRSQPECGSIRPSGHPHVPSAVRYAYAVHRGVVPAGTHAVARSPGVSFVKPSAHVHTPPRCAKATSKTHVPPVPQ